MGCAKRYATHFHPLRCLGQVNWNDSFDRLLYLLFIHSRKTRWRSSHIISLLGAAFHFLVIHSKKIKLGDYPPLIFAGLTFGKDVVVEF